MALKLVYSDLALGAAEDAAITATNAEDFSTPALLPRGANTGAIATIEHNGWGLSQDYKTKDAQPFALWTESKSNAAGVFTTPPVITIEFAAQYTSTGLALRFSPGAMEWCSEIRVVWYQDGVIKDSGTYYPHTANFALENTVEAFDKIVITLVKTSLPNRRAKLEHIGIGIIREIDGKELTAVSVLHEIDLISEAVPINVLDASFHSTTAAEYLFQNKQPVEAYDGEKLIGVYYIEKGSRTGARDYTISCQDAIGTLELDTYGGGLWFDAIPLAEMLADVIGGAFELDISAELAGVTLKGYLPASTKRAALQQIAFAAGVCIDTAGTSKIRAFPPPTGTGVEIPASETYTGGKVETSDTVTAVSVLGFDIKNARPGEDDEYIEVDKVQYRYVTTEYIAENPNIVAGALPNQIVYDKCYLINATNGQERADAILAYHMRRKKYSAAHILHNQQTGDRASVVLPWGETHNANIVKMKISVSGINASDTDFLLD